MRNFICCVDIFRVNIRCIRLLVLYEGHVMQLADFIVVGGAVIGSTLIASNTGYNKYGYVAFLLSSVATLVLLSQAENVSKSLEGITWFYIVVNIVGFFRHLKGQ